MDIIVCKEETIDIRFHYYLSVPVTSVNPFDYGITAFLHIDFPVLSYIMV